MSTESRQKRQQLTSHFYTSYSSQTGVSTDVDQVVCSETLTGYRGPRQPGVINPCSHSKVTVIPHYTDFGTQTSSGQNVTGFRGLFPLSAVYTPWDSYPVFRLSPSLTRSEAKALMDELTGDIPPVVSVPNMLLELPQTLNLWHELKSPLMALFHDPGVRKKWQAGSNALLSQQFGLFPLMGDIKALVTSKRNVHTELQRICAIPAKFTSTRKKLGRRNLTGSFTLVNPNIYRVKQVDWSGEGSLFYRRRQRVALDCSDPLIISQMASALYGWDRPLSTLWEATPFSFVADWFLPVGDYLAGLEKSVFSGSIEVANLGWTAKGTALATIESDGAGFQTGIWRETHTVKCTQFSRGTGIPTSPLWDELTIPGVKQSILGAALFLQR